MAINPDLLNFDEYARNNPYMFHNHIAITKVSEEHCQVKVDIVPESRNLYGAVHGGLMYSMADIVCGIAARVDGNNYVTQSTHMNYLRNTKCAVIYCDTDIVKRGRTLVIVHFRISDDAGRLLADGVVDMIRSK